MATDSSPVGPRKLRDLLRAITAPHQGRKSIWLPNLDGLPRDLGVDAIRLTLFGEEGSEPGTRTVPPGQDPWSTPADLLLACRHDAQTVGTLEVRAGPGGTLDEDQRWALEMVADQIALEARHRQLEQILTTSALEGECSAAARMIWPD